MAGGRDGETGVTDQLRDLTERMSLLVKGHVELATAEALASAKVAAKDGAFVATGVVVALIGYVMLAFALAWGLGHRLGTARSFLLVGGLHLVVGGVVAAVYAARLRGRDRPVLPQTKAELQRDGRFARRLRQGLRS